MPRGTSTLSERILTTVEIPIAQGCTSHCSYCFCRLARGPLASVSASTIGDKVRSALERGAVEIRFSSLDTSCWGEDRTDGARLPDLLKAVSSIDGRFRIRVGMMSPQSLRPIVDPFLDSLTAAPFYKFLHLPVQSGSNSVLANMRRGYSVQEFEAIFRRAKDRIPDLTLATDVIVGFPGETEEDFEASMELLERLRPPILNVTRFSPRPMTEAARRPQLRSAEAKRRSRPLTALRLKISREVLEELVGTTREAWPSEVGTSETTVARLSNYLPVVLEGRVPLGREVRVRITGARSTYLLGRPSGPVSPESGLGP